MKLWIDAIASLRGWLDTNHMTNRQINDREEQTVAMMCDRHFRDLFPLRDGKVNQYIKRIMAYNDVQEPPHADQWLITITALKRLTHCGQSVICDVLRDRASDIQFHHDQHQLGLYHNQKGKNAPLIESVIS